jgi:hypothetical protein
MIELLDNAGDVTFNKSTTDTGGDAVCSLVKLRAGTHRKSYRRRPVGSAELDGPPRRAAEVPAAEDRLHRQHVGHPLEHVLSEAGPSHQLQSLRDGCGMRVIPLQQ